MIDNSIMPISLVTVHYCAADYYISMSSVFLLIPCTLHSVACQTIFVEDVQSIIYYDQRNTHENDVMCENTSVVFELTMSIMLIHILSTVHIPLAGIA